MPIYTASRYPNGKRKSELFDLFLTHFDFHCTPEEFDQDLEYILLEETLGVQNCRWRKDVDGRLVVSGLELADPTARIVITSDAFALTLKEGGSPLVFISYAREDAIPAQRITDLLAQAGFRPWIDQRHLRGGHRWKQSIAAIIRKSDFFVALLSARSVNKQGFVQREIRQALEVAAEKPDNRVFILPVRLNPCEPSHSALNELNRIDVFPDWQHGTREIIRSLHSARLGL